MVQNIKNFLACLVVSSLLIYASCSQGNIAAPGQGDELRCDTPQAIDTGGKRVLWGLWQFHGDTRTGEFEVVPLRYGIAHLNALVFLEPPANKLLKITGLSFSENQIDANITLTHPFLAQKEFTAFDVKGIIITPGNNSSYPGPFVVLADEDATHLANPDGHTLWWGPYVFPPDPVWPNQGYIDGLLGTPNEVAKFRSNVNAYKYFCDDLGPDDDVSLINTANRGVFSTGKKNTRHYTIKVMESPFEFNYAVDANWAWPKKIPPASIPDDFPLHANQPEAYRVEVEEVKNTLYYDGYFGGGDLVLDVKVYTWRDPSTTFCVFIESPSVFTQVFTKEPVEVGDGWATYQIEATCCTTRETGPLFVLIGVQTKLAKINFHIYYTEGYVTAYFTYKTNVGATPPTDGPPGTPRGIHRGDFFPLPKPPEIDYLEYGLSHRPAVRGNHIVTPTLTVCICESWDGGETFTSTVFEGAFKCGISHKTNQIAMDSQHGVHLTITGEGHHWQDPKILHYFYKPAGGEPISAIFPFGKEPPFSYPWFAYPFIDSDDRLHIVYIGYGPEADPYPPRCYEITSVDYQNFSDPVEYLKFPDYYGWAPQDDTEFAMADDGELYIAFQADEIDGDDKDIYFTHGFPGAMTEAVRVNEGSYPPHQKSPQIMAEGKDCYILWRNCIDEINNIDYDYPAVQARLFPDGGEPSPPYDLIYCSQSFQGARISPNPWNMPIFHFDQINGDAGSGPGAPSKHLHSRKLSTFYFPEGSRGNFIPYLHGDVPDDAGTPLTICVTESGIVAITFHVGYTQPHYSFSPFDFY